MSLLQSVVKWEKENVGGENDQKLIKHHTRDCPGPAVHATSLVVLSSQWHLAWLIHKERRMGLRTGARRRDDQKCTTLYSVSVRARRARKTIVTDCLVLLINLNI